MASKGKLIVIEGLEGAGKSTAVNTIIEQLSQKGIQTLSVREPGGTDIGEEIRSIIKNLQFGRVMDDRTELLLFYAARIQLLEQLVKPALAQGKWVVADRFELSTKAYQEGGRGLSPEFIQQLSAFCLNGFKPDLTLFLDITPEQGMARVKSRGAPDRIEHQSIDFFHCVHQKYMDYLRSDPHSVIIDSSHPIQVVHEAIKKTMDHFIAQYL